MVSLGVDWYQTFWDGFITYVKERNIKWEKDFSDKEWSSLMFDFLEGLAKDMNYHFEKEESTIKSTRFDMTWRSSDTPPTRIYIEHENQWVNVALKEEVPKLADYKADLHVCITYVRDDEYPGDEYAKQAKSILEQVGYAEEFLLILGSSSSNSPTDWVCHRLWQEPHLELEKLVLPSPVVVGPLKDVGKGESAEVEDWMENRLRVWKRIQKRGGSVTRLELHEVAKEVGMDNRGLGGFFVGKNKSLYWKGDRAHLSSRALELVKKLGKQVD